MKKEDMALPIELTQIIRKPNECLKHCKIKVDASKINGIWNNGNCTSILLNADSNREEMEIVESAEEVCNKIGGAFYDYDKIEMAKKILSKGGGVKGRCYHRSPCDYFIQYTGDNADEVIKFLHEIDANIDMDDYDIKEIEIDGEKLLHFDYEDGFIREEFSVSIGSFIVVDDKFRGDEINEYSEYEFHHSFHIANDDIADYDEGGAQ